MVGASFELLTAIGRVELGSGGHFSRRVHKLVHLTAHVWAALPRALDQLRGPDEPKRAIPTALTKPNIMITRITNFMSQLVVKRGPVGPNWAAGVGVLREVPALAKNSSTDQKSD